MGFRRIRTDTDAPRTADDRVTFRVRRSRPRNGSKRESPFLDGREAMPRSYDGRLERRRVLDRTGGFGTVL
jgi:hypothetical protein